MNIRTQNILGENADSNLNYFFQTNLPELFSNLRNDSNAKLKHVLLEKHLKSVFLWSMKQIQNEKNEKCTWKDLKLWTPVSKRLLSTDWRLWNRRRDLRCIGEPPHPSFLPSFGTLMSWEWHCLLHVKRTNEKSTHVIYDQNMILFAVALTVWQTGFNQMYCQLLKIGPQNSVRLYKTFYQ